MLCRSSGRSICFKQANSQRISGEAKSSRRIRDRRGDAFSIQGFVHGLQQCPCSRQHRRSGARFDILTGDLGGDAGHLFLVRLEYAAFDLPAVRVWTRLRRLLPRSTARIVDDEAVRGLDDVRRGSESWSAVGQRGRRNHRRMSVSDARWPRSIRRSSGRRRLRRRVGGSLGPPCAEAASTGHRWCPGIRRPASIGRRSGSAGPSPDSRRDRRL